MSARLCSFGFCSASYNRAASVQFKAACSKSPRWNEFKPSSICRAAGEVSGAAAADAGLTVKTKRLPIKLRKRPRTRKRLHLRPRRQGRLILKRLRKAGGSIHVLCPDRETFVHCSFIFFTIAEDLITVPLKASTIIYFARSHLSNS